MTDRQTDRQTNIRTFRLIESIGPEGRCFEKFPECFEGGKGFGSEHALMVHKRFCDSYDNFECESTFTLKEGVKLSREVEASQFFNGFFCIPDL